MSRLLALLVLLAPATARANPADMFGFGAHGTAFGNALVASTDGLTAAIYNPASAAVDERRQLGLGYFYAHLELRLSGRDPDLMDARGTWLAGSLPFRIGRAQLAISTALHMPDQFIMRVHSVPATDQRLVMWDNRPHRVVFNTGFAARLGDLFSLGIGATFLGGARGRGAEFDVETLPGRTVADAGLDLELPLRVAPIAGILFTPRPDLRFGARFTGEIELKVAIDVLAFLQTPGTDLEGTTTIAVRALNYFTPRELALGGAFDAGGWTVAVEATWQQWSRIPRVSSSLDVDVRLGIAVDVVPLNVPPPRWRDVWIPRVGVERRLDLGEERELALRGGYFFVPSPVPAQRDLTSYADSARHALTLGAGFRFVAFDFPFTAELGLQAHILHHRETRKREPGLPGGDFSSGGAVFVASAGLRMEIP